MSEMALCSSPPTAGHHSQLIQHEPLQSVDDKAIQKPRNPATQKPNKIKHRRTTLQATRIKLGDKRAT